VIAKRCCRVGAVTPGTGPEQEAAPFFHSKAGWLIPTAILAFLPKCPVCVAAYIAIITGVGVSVEVADYLRTSLVILCLAALLCVVQTQARTALRRMFRKTRADLPVSPGSGKTPYERTRATITSEQGQAY
jgi:hypothetical protein